jgi:hypothetical protein
LKAFLEQNLSWPHLMSVQSVGLGVAEDFDPVRGEVLRSTTAGVLEETVNPAATREMHLVVTASPAAQEVIGRLIGLMLEAKQQPAVSAAQMFRDPGSETSVERAPDSELRP